MCYSAWLDQRFTKVVSGMKNDLLLLVLFYGIVQHRTSRFYYSWFYPTNGSALLYKHDGMVPFNQLKWWHVTQRIITHTLYIHLINKVILYSQNYWGLKFSWTSWLLKQTNHKSFILENLIHMYVAMCRG